MTKKSYKKEEDCSCSMDIFNKDNIITKYELRNVIIKDPKSVDPKGNFNIKPNTFSTYIKNVTVQNKISKFLPLITNGITNLSSVNVLKYGPDGNLYIGTGNAISNGIEPIWCIVKWNGKEFERVGNGVNGLVNAIEFDSVGNLYIGGSFSTNIPKTGEQVKILNRIAKYNPLTDSWDQILNNNGIVGVSAEVLTLKYSSNTNRLYIGGNGNLIWVNTSSPLCYLDIDTNNIVNVTATVIGSTPRTITGFVRCLEFDISDPRKLYIGGKLSYRSSNIIPIVYTDVFLGLITDTPNISFPDFYTPPGTSLQTGELFTIVSVSNEKLYLGGSFTYRQNLSIPVEMTLRNLCLFNPTRTTNAFTPISTVTITSSGSTFTSVLYPFNTVRSINIGDGDILYIGGDFVNFGYINPNLNNTIIPFIGAGRYAEFNPITNSWNADDFFALSINTIIFRKNKPRTKNNIIIGSSSTISNNYSTGLIIYTNDYINLVVDNKTLITLTENGSMATISSNEVCGKTSGFLYSNSNYDPFLN